MFERLLLGLMGLSSDLIQEDLKGRFRLVPEYEGPEDRVLVDELLLLGSTYKFLNRFLDEVKERNPYTLGTGMYLSALADGLGSILYDFRETLATFESYLLETPTATLSDLRNDLNEWFAIFDALQARIFVIHNEKKHGCHLLKYVYSETKSCGQETVRQRLETLFKRCNKVLFDQLASWLLYGILKDPHCEFFIRPDQDGFGVVDDFVPPYLTEHASTIRQIGCIVAKFYEESYFEKSIYAEKEDEYLSKLEAACEDLDMLSPVIASLSAFTSDYLWDQLVVQQRLEYHLEAILKTVFMGRGDLILQWMNKVQQHFIVPFEENHLSIASECLRNCFYQAYPDEDMEFIERIRFVTSKSDATDTWSLLMLVYDLPPDLHCLLSAREVRSLGYAFQMLLAVRRAELALNSTLGSRLSPQAMKLRYEMEFFVSNFESYLHMDVLHISFNKLRGVLHGSRSCDALKKALSHFVQDVTCMMFVSLPRFKETLLKVFQTCLRFPMYINADLRSIEQEFRSQQDILRRCFQVLQEHTTSQLDKRNECIMRFLYRLDYNQQYQATRREVKAIGDKLRGANGSSSSSSRN
ncbi:gamma-tubulin complex component 4 [Galendromus occidentalis]|uniref:Gamma-tubulin complex component n=1 Tax=Galendromus occidentalis TaxID=34638 RepID=A0AAJ7SJC4_9ACAR|nr:gamma-tubulin complex component 4 [Galendromus occidentalis]